jgi:hypothetical protein
MGQAGNFALLLQSAWGEVKFTAPTLAQLITATAQGELTLTMAPAKINDLPEEYHDIVGQRPVYAFKLMAGSQIVSAFKELAELFLPYTVAAGEDINSLTVYHFSAENKAEKLNDASYHSERKGMICSVSGFSLFAVANEEAPQFNACFSDVPKSHWAASYIYSLAERGVINGRTATLFSPEASLTRAELAVLLARLSEEELPQAKIHFVDVIDKAWYAQELTWAVKADIIHGVGDNRFAPQQAVSRQDMAVMLLRYATYNSMVLPTTKEARTFSDNAVISAYARDAIAALQLAGFVGGYEDGSFRPKGNISRAEAAKLLAMIEDI